MNIKTQHPTPEIAVPEKTYGCLKQVAGKYIPRG